MAQISRRRGSTVFMTLRDAVADISVPVTCSTTRFDGLNPPLVEGASVVVHAKPTTTPTAGPLRSTPARSGWSASASCSPGSSAAGSCWRPRGCSRPSSSGRCPSSRLRRAGHRPAVGRRARRRGERPPPWPRRSPSRGRASRAARPPEVIDALDRLDATRGGRDRRRPRRRLGRGPAAVLRRGADPGRAQARTPVVSAIGHEPDTPLLDLVADVRASTPTDAAKLVVPDVAEERARLHDLRGRARRAVTGRLDAERRLLVATRTRAVMTDPLAMLTPHRSRWPRCARVAETASRPEWSREADRSGASCCPGAGPLTAVHTRPGVCRRAASRRAGGARQRRGRAGRAAARPGRPR